jgi:hypothetical protein
MISVDFRLPTLTKVDGKQLGATNLLAFLSRQMYEQLKRKEEEDEEVRTP